MCPSTPFNLLLRHFASGLLEEKETVTVFGSNFGSLGQSLSVTLFPCPNGVFVIGQPCTIQQVITHMCRVQTIVKFKSFLKFIFSIVLLFELYSCKLVCCHMRKVPNCETCWVCCIFMLFTQFHEQKSHCRYIF